jgi:hypothetical protein
MHTLQLGHNDHGPLTNFLWTFLKIHLLMPIEVPNYQLLVVPMKVPIAGRTSQLQDQFGLIFVAFP